MTWDYNYYLCWLGSKIESGKEKYSGIKIRGRKHTYFV